MNNTINKIFLIQTILSNSDNNREKFPSDYLYDIFKLNNSKKIIKSIKYLLFRINKKKELIILNTSIRKCFTNAILNSNPTSLRSKRFDDISFRFEKIKLIENYYEKNILYLKNPIKYSNMFFEVFNKIDVIFNSYSNDRIDRYFLSHLNELSKKENFLNKKENKKIIMGIFNKYLKNYFLLLNTNSKNREIILLLFFIKFKAMGILKKNQLVFNSKYLVDLKIKQINVI